MKNETFRLTEPFQVLEHLDFFLEGMRALNDPKGANAKYTNESFFKLLCNVLGMVEKGLVFLVRSKNQKLLGFCVAFETMTFMAEKCMFLVEVYSNGKSDQTTKDGLEFVERETRRLGLKTIKAATRRFSGSSLRLFEERWGFRREYQTFTKEV